MTQRLWKLEDLVRITDVGLNGLTQGSLDNPQVPRTALEALARRGFADTEAPESQPEL